MTRGREGRRALAAVCLLALLGSGCTPSDPPPPPATTTPSPTPTENAQEREERLAYAAAEKSYRDFRAEYNRLTQSGGATKPTRVLQMTSGGSYQKELMRYLQAFKDTGYRSRGEEVIPPIQRLGYSPESVLIKACEDDRKVKTYSDKGKLVDSGDILVVKLTVRKVDGLWRVWSGSGESASTCNGF